MKKKKLVVKKKANKPIDYLPLDITIGPYEQFTLDLDDLEDVKCECGSEKVYGRSVAHSDWCPKYKKD